MRAVRICKSRFSALDGQGASLHGGRWNSPGHPAVYLSATRSLSLLEVLVNLGSIDDSAELFPEHSFVCIVVELPDEIVSFDSPWWSVSSRSTWARRNRKETQSVGDTWLSQKPNVALAVPSVIIPEENNFLMHPTPVSSGMVVIESVSPFSFDPRLRRRM